MHRILLAGLLAAFAPSALAQGTAPAAPAKAETCVRCHGPAGNSPTGAYPILAGQTFRYLYLQLRDFQEGRRKDPEMSLEAQGLTREEMFALAEYFSKQKPRPNGFKADAARVARGSKKADETLCTMCHSGSFAGQNEIPRVAGQHYDYIVKQLTDFKARTRTNDAGNMTAVANTLKDEDILDLAHFVANLY